jgi:hypothetical protein
MPGQTTQGAGPLTRISGQLLNGDDIDVYVIRIDNPPGFLASTSASAGGSASFDTQLFLFNVQGNGVSHNDDDPQGGLQSQITAQFVPSPGIYALAISKWNRDALNPANQRIWNDAPINVERPPDGPGAPGPLANWTTITPQAGGSYSISLAGATYSAGPLADCTTCPGDLTGNATRDGGDIARFLDCILQGPNIVAGCNCAEFSGDGAIDSLDVTPFVQVLLAPTPCQVTQSFATSAQILARINNPPIGMIQLFFTRTQPTDTSVQLAGPPYYTGVEIPTEIIQMDLQANDPMLGPVILRERFDQASRGVVQNVLADQNGNFLSGDSFFDVFVTMQVPNFGMNVDTGAIPVPVQALGITQLPPYRTNYFSGPINVPIYSNNQPIGEILDVIHIDEPNMRCIYEVTCIDGPCTSCSMRLQDRCYIGEPCGGPGPVCPLFYTRTCCDIYCGPASSCCVEYTFVGCLEVTNEQECPAGEDCPCDPAQGACCLPDGTCQVMNEADCRDQGGDYQGDNTTCTPTGACCKPGGSCVDTIQACCTKVGGTFYAGATCQTQTACCKADGTCAMKTIAECCGNGEKPHVGANCNTTAACCKADGTCVMLTQECCGDINGTWHNGKDCATKAACCLANGTCRFVTEECCGDIGGTWHAGKDCNTTGACCFNDLTCQSLTPECCADLGGEYKGDGTSCFPNPCTTTCTSGRKYAYGFKGVNNLIGGQSSIETRYRKICSETAGTDAAYHVAYVNISRDFTGGQHWAQAGWGRERNGGSNTIRTYRYAEIQGNAYNVNYDTANAPAQNSTHAYAVDLDKAAGKWTYSYDGTAFQDFTDAGWANQTGTRVLWSGEIYNKEDDMPGIPLTRCAFTNCRYRLDGGAYQNAGLAAGDMRSSNFNQWGANRLSGTSMEIWDWYPLP